MDAARWARMQALFHDALELPDAERTAFLTDACGDDVALRNDVLALLAEDARRTSLLDQGLAHAAHGVFREDRPVHESIGPYRLLDVLGKGGMGVVYLAERADLDAQVAIKVLRDPLLSRSRQERFAREARTLAHLVHPSIARLYDAATLPDGTPYIVMEYVRGMPLTEYCEGRACTLDDRVRLFRAVGDAVHYAHRQAVVHRDLKPSNILVTEDGPEGRSGIKLLDFGIAKQLDDRDTPATQTGQWLMTPAYAAPEQLQGEPIGVYTDVYALGVILYELLTGTLPFDLTGRTPGQAEQVMLDQVPPKPSERARDSAERGRGVPPASLSRQAWADLDVLCMKALHKDPQRRYPTVEALLRDLDHFLHREPLEARPDSLGYRLRLFVRRHQRPVVAAALVTGLIVLLVGYYTVRLTAARDAALDEAARAQRIERFMMALFEGGEPTIGPPDSLRVTSLLDRGVREAQVLDGEPVVQAELYQTLGRLYQQLGDLDRADSLLQAAFEQRRSLHGAGHADVAQSQVALGLLRIDQAALDEAEHLIREGLATIQRQLPADHPAAAEALTALGKALTERGDYDQAVGVLEEAVRRRAAQDPSSAPFSESLMELANTHFYAGHYATSDSLNRLVLAVDQQLYGRRHPHVANSLINLGATRFQLGYYVEAEQLYRQALEITLAHYGSDRPETAANLRMLGQALSFQECYDEALGMLRPALAIHERVYGTEHPNVASLLNEIGIVALQQGDLATAETHFNRMVSIYRIVYDDHHYLIGIALSNLASVYMENAQHDRAEAVYRDAVARFTDTLGPDHLQTAVARIKLGRALLRQQRPAEAVAHLLAGYEILKAQTSPSVSWLQAARADLAAVYEALGQREEAERFEAEHAAVEAQRSDP